MWKLHEMHESLPRAGYWNSSRVFNRCNCTGQYLCALFCLRRLEIRWMAKWFGLVALCFIDHIWFSGVLTVYFCRLQIDAFFKKIHPFWKDGHVHVVDQVRFLETLQTEKAHQEDVTWWVLMFKKNAITPDEGSTWHFVNIIKIQIQFQEERANLIF